jgi:hypothetical protein
MDLRTLFVSTGEIIDDIQNVGAEFGFVVLQRTFDNLLYRCFDASLLS